MPKSKKQKSPPKTDSTDGPKQTSKSKGTTTLINRLLTATKLKRVSANGQF